MSTSTAFGLLLSLALLPLPAYALDDVRLIVGVSDDNDDATLWRVALTDRWDKQWQADGWVVGGYSELTLGRWDAKGRQGDDTLYELALTPVFRLHRTAANGQGIFVDAGLGLHFLSQDELSGKRLGSHYQFGTHLGGGYQWRHSELTLRVQHISNAGFATPNPGINFLSVGLGFRI